MYLCEEEKLFICVKRRRCLYIVYACEEEKMLITRANKEKLLISVKRRSLV